jgi:hypothetical protein
MCLEFASDNLKIILRIIEAYLILHPLRFMQVLECLAALTGRYIQITFSMEFRVL